MEGVTSSAGIFLLAGIGGRSVESKGGGLDARFAIFTSTGTEANGGADTETWTGADSIFGTDGIASLATSGGVVTGAGKDGMEPNEAAA